MKVLANLETQTITISLHLHQCQARLFYHYEEYLVEMLWIAIEIKIRCCEKKDTVVNEFQEGDQTSIAYLWRQTPMQTPVNTDGDDYYNINTDEDDYYNTILIQMNNINREEDDYYEKENSLSVAMYLV